MALIIDTGPLYASLDAADPDHQACAQLLESTNEPLVIPSPVLVEAEWLATSRIGPDGFDPVLASVEEGSLGVIDLQRTDWARVRELCRQYLDLPLGLVDASMVAVAERLDETKVATLDHRHFTVVRPSHTHALTLLPD